MRLPPEEIQNSHKLIDDLGIDSLGRVSLFYELCAHYDVDKDESEANKWTLISDVIESMKGMQ